jgi:hypothetical protein
VRSCLSLIVLAGCRQIFGITDPTPMSDASIDAQVDAPSGFDAPLPGPIVHFAFETLDNDKIVDSSGHQHDGSCFGISCPMLVAGKFGHGLMFGSVAAMPTNFTVAPSTEFAFDHGFTAAFWIELSYLPTNQGCPLTQEGVFQICVAGTGAITYLPMATGGGTLTTTAHLQPNTYAHVAVTFDSARAKIYINGIADQSTGEPMPAVGSSELLFGTDLDTGSTLPAVLDEFQLWTRALSASEIAALAGP